MKTKAAIAYTADGDFSVLVDKVGPCSEINQGFAEMHEGSCVQVVLTF